MYTDSSSIFLEPGEPQDISEDYWVETLQAAGSLDVDALWGPFPVQERPHVARQVYRVVTASQQRASYWLAKAFEEHGAGTNQNSVLWRGLTRSWGNATSVRLRDLSGWVMYFDEFRGREYVRYRNVIDSIRDATWRIVDPDFVYAKEGRRSIRRVAERFVGLSENTENYIRGIVERMNLYVAEDGDTAVALTDTIIERLRARGLDAHDIRGEMPYAGGYTVMPNDAWIYTAIHHTTRSKIPATLAAETNSWIRHAKYHIEKNGWPGIAYAIGWSQSGRIFVLRDINLQGFHAFTANRNTLGLAADIGLDQQPSEAMLESMHKTLLVLHNDCPEFVSLRGAPGTFGHQELDFIDSRNAGTGCPGHLLDFIRQYRSGAPVENEREINGYIVAGPFLSAYRDLESIDRHWSTYGVPLGGMIGNIQIDGVARIVQQWDRAPWVMTEGDGVVIAKPEQIVQIEAHLGIGDDTRVRLDRVTDHLKAALDEIKVLSA